MTNAENPRDVFSFSMHESILNPNLQPDILNAVNNFLASGLLTEETYQKIKNLFVGRGERVETYFEKKLKVKEVKWQEGRLVEDISKHQITLSEEEEETLRALSMQNGHSPGEIVREIIRENLMQKERG